MTNELVTVGLDPSWLCQHIDHEGERPVAATFDGFIGTGQMSRNARFSLTWKSDAGPTSVVVKVPSSEAGTRQTSFDYGAYQKECDFYSRIAPLVDVAAPAALAVHFDEAGQDFALVLEDLSGSTQGDQFVEPTDEELSLALEQVVAMQAPIWGATDGPEFATYRVDAGEGADLTSALLPAFVPAVIERLGDGLEPEIVTLIDQFCAVAGQWSKLRGKPTTLVHGDFRPDNFMYAVEADAPPIMIVDWQTLSLGLGVTDVAYLLGGAVAPERRRAIEGSILRDYRSLLAKRGVEYSEQECTDDYAIGSLHGIVIAILATTFADKTERGDALFTLMLNRHGRHALDLGALQQVAQAG